MPLTDTLRSQLDTAAAAIVKGQKLIGRDANIFNLDLGIGFEDDQRRISRVLRDDRVETIAYLEERVGHLSSYQFTVRVVDELLFEYPSKSTGTLSLVRCDYNTPEGEVMDFIKGMILVEICPYAPGLTIGAQPASQCEVNRLREAAHREREERRIGEAARVAEQEFLEGLVTRFRPWLELCDDQDLRISIEKVLTTVPTLTQLSVLCAKLGITLNDVAYSTG